MRTHLLLLALMAACSGSSGARRQPDEGSLVRGNARESANQKTSDNRPRPGDEDQSALDPDRFGVQELTARRRGQHESEHSEQALSQEGFSHPACSTLPGEDRRACPILRASWSSLLLVPGGVELGMDRPAEGPERLRLRLLCHVAYGQAASGEDGCPLHVAKVRVAVTESRGRLIVRIVTDDPSRVDDLRRNVKQLVSPK